MLFFLRRASCGLHKVLISESEKLPTKTISASPTDPQLWKLAGEGLGGSGFCLFEVFPTSRQDIKETEQHSNFHFSCSSFLNLPQHLFEPELAEDTRMVPSYHIHILGFLSVQSFSSLRRFCVSVNYLWRANVLVWKWWDLLIPNFGNTDRRIIRVVISCNMAESW